MNRFSEYILTLGESQYGEVTRNQVLAASTFVWLMALWIHRAEPVMIAVDLVVFGISYGLYYALLTWRYSMPLWGFGLVAIVTGVSLSLTANVLYLYFEPTAGSMPYIALSMLGSSDGPALLTVALLLLMRMGTKLLLSTNALSIAIIFLTGTSMFITWSIDDPDRLPYVAMLSAFASGLCVVTTLIGVPRLLLRRSIARARGLSEHAA